MKKTYLITGIEPMLLKNFKSACAHYEISMKETFIKHMQNIVNDFEAWKRAKYVKRPKLKKGGKKG